MSSTKMKQKGFTVNQATGLGSFPELKTKFGIINFITYSNKIWSNMNPFFAKNDDKRKEIEKKDQKLADIVGTKFVGVITTPPEGTLIHFDKNMYEYLNSTNKEDEKGYKFVLVRANAVILTVPNTELVFAPSDCPIGIFAHKDWQGVIAMHLGSPQVAQRLHDKTLSFFKGLFDEVSISKFHVYFTPYICPKHYTLSDEKYRAYTQELPNLEQFLLPSDKENEWNFDFIGYAKQNLKENWGITRFHESGICTYQEAMSGNLFSHDLSTEDEKKFPPGSFNVAIALK